MSSLRFRAAVWLPAATLLVAGTAPVHAGTESNPRYCASATEPTSGVPGCKVLKKMRCWRYDSNAYAIPGGTLGVKVFLNETSDNCTDREQKDLLDVTYSVEWEDSMTMSGTGSVGGDIWSVVEASLEAKLEVSDKHTKSYSVHINPTFGPCERLTAHHAIEYTEKGRAAVDHYFLQAYKVTERGDGGGRGGDAPCNWSDVHDPISGNGIVFVDAGEGQTIGEADVLVSDGRGGIYPSSPDCPEESPCLSGPREDDRGDDDGGGDSGGDDSSPAR